jgi:hypothetical protein
VLNAPSGKLFVLEAAVQPGLLPRRALRRRLLLPLPLRQVAFSLLLLQFVNSLQLVVLLHLSLLPQDEPSPPEPLLQLLPHHPRAPIQHRLGGALMATVAASSLQLACPRLELQGFVSRQAGLSVLSA